MDAPADGGRAVRRVHLALRPPPGRRERPGDTNETEVARVLDELLTRAEAGPVDKLTDRITGRARVAGAAHRPPARADDTPSETPCTTGQDSRDGPLVTVIPFGVFDADAEAEKWL